MDQAGSLLPSSETRARDMAMWCDKFQKLLHAGQIEEHGSPLQVAQEDSFDNLKFCLNQRENQALKAAAAQVVGSLALLSFSANADLAAQLDLVRSLAELVESEQMELAEASATAICNLATSENGCKALLNVGCLATILNRMGKALVKADSVGDEDFMDCLEALVSALHGISLGPFPLPLGTLCEHESRAVLCDLKTVYDLYKRSTRGEEMRVSIAQLVVRYGMEDSASSGMDRWQNRESETCYLQAFMKLSATELQSFFGNFWESQPLLLCSREMGSTQVNDECFQEANNLVQEYSRLESRSKLGQPSQSPKRISMSLYEGTAIESISKNPEQLSDGLDLLMNLPSLQSDEKFLRSFLPTCVACPPASSLGCDPATLIKGMGVNLAGPMVHGQDVTLVRSIPLQSTLASVLAPAPTELEQYYIPRNRSSYSSADDNENTPYLVSASDCTAAYKEGYSIALRGLTYRIPEVARIADSLARALGQVSVGANLYLTPPSSQGLARHYDDHCVLICQLAGHKRWKVFQAEVKMPSLYLPLQRPSLWKFPEDHLEGEWVLEKGDVLYIPRGCPHEADTMETLLPKAKDHVSARHVSTSTGTGASVSGMESLGKDWESSKEFMHGKGPKKEYQDSEENEVKDGISERNEPGLNARSYSLHVTFALEVEPLCQWQGFLHIALRTLCTERGPKNRNMASHDLSIPRKRMRESAINPQVAAEWLLHLEIHRLAQMHSELRKACMLGAACKPALLHALADIPPSVSTTTTGLEVASLSSVRFNLSKDEIHNDDWPVGSCDESPSVRAVRAVHSFCGKLLSWLFRSSTFDLAIKVCDSLISSPERRDIMWWVELCDSESPLGEVLSHIRELHVRDSSALRVAFDSLKQKLANSNFVEIKESFLSKINELREIRRQFTCGMLHLNSKFDANSCDG